MSTVPVHLSMSTVPVHLRTFIPFQKESSKVHYTGHTASRSSRVRGGGAQGPGPVLPDGRPEASPKELMKAAAAWLLSRARRIWALNSL